MPLDGNHNWVYDEQNGVDRLSAVGGWVKRWLHWGGCGAVLRGDEETYVDMPFIRCIEEDVYATRLARIVCRKLDLGDTDPILHSLDYVAFPRPYDSLYYLTNFDYWLKEINFESRFRVRQGSKPSVNWHFSDIFGIPTRRHDELFVKVPSWLADYAVSRLLFAPTPIVFAYHSTLEINKRRLALFFRIAVPEHYLYCLMSSLSLALLGGPFDSIPVFEGAQELIESGVLLPLSKGAHEFVSDVGLLSIIQGKQFDYAQAYLAYHRCLEVDWDDVVSVGWFPYGSASGDVLGLPAREVTISKRSVHGIQMKRWVGAVAVKYRGGPSKTLEEAQLTVSSVVRSSSEGHDHVQDVPLIEEEDIIEEEDAPWDLRDLTSKDDRGPYALQRVQELCKCYGLEVPSDVRSIQKVVQDA